MSSGIHPYISRSVYVFSFVSVVVICMVTASWLYMNTAEEDKTGANRALKIWKNKVDASRASNSIIDEYENTYLQLVNNGVIGNEDRLSWYESIQDTSESRGMQSVKYSISSQARLNEREVAKAFKGLDLFRSVMTLDIRMSHEGDLFALLNNLKTDANGLFLIDQCDVERVDMKADKTPRLDNMRAYCELSWYTIRARQPRSRG